VPNLLLWGLRDGGTVLYRPRPGDEISRHELDVPAGWDYAAAPDSGEVVAMRGREIAFGRVTGDGIQLDEPLPVEAPESGLAPACVGTDTPAALLTSDSSRFLVAFRDGGFASIDAVGTLGDCAWLDRERLLVVYEGAGDPMRIHSVTSGELIEAAIGGRNPTVSRGLLVSLDRAADPDHIVVWRTSLIGVRRDQALATREPSAEIARVAPVEPGTRYLSGTISPDGTLLAIVGDREQGGESESLLWLVDFREGQGSTWSLEVDFPLVAVSWPD
jgi:hypothetical protein